MAVTKTKTKLERAVDVLIGEEKKRYNTINRLQLRVEKQISRTASGIMF